MKTAKTGLARAVSAIALAALLSAGSSIAWAETKGPVTDDLGVVEIPEGAPIVIGGYWVISGPDTALGVDSQRVFAELKVLKDTAAVSGFAPYLKRAKAAGKGAESAKPEALPGDGKDKYTAEQLAAAAAAGAGMGQMTPKAPSSVPAVTALRCSW